MGNNLVAACGGKHKNLPEEEQEKEEALKKGYEVLDKLKQVKKSIDDKIQEFKDKLAY